VEDLAFRATERGKLRELLKSMHDIERLVARISLGTAGPRDVVALGRSLALLPRLHTLAAGLQAPLLASLMAEIDVLADIRASIDRALVDEPPLQARDGGVIRDGVDAELDEMRAISRGGKAAIAAMEEAERERTGIASLKIRYNRVFGYYIEISKSNLASVPADYHRKQTIAGGERFVTPALKEYEDKVVGADDRIAAREVAIFEELRAAIAVESPRILDTARAVAAIDVLAALADAASAGAYTKPKMHDADEYVVTDARHPIVEQHVGGSFVPNDVRLDCGASQLVILTGPNMGGKSTYLRQVALMALMAQAGSFVPARHAKLSIVDRIFARVGASDNIARGQSTFMVEMQETATILHAATSRSLVILDEIGRGTATFDGLSLAWAVAEHLASNARARPKTVFATHYHELTDLADGLAGVVNYHVAAREYKDDIVFLHKIVPGRSDRSYGSRWRASPVCLRRWCDGPPRSCDRSRKTNCGAAAGQPERQPGSRPETTGPVPDGPRGARGPAADRRAPAADRRESDDAARGPDDTGRAQARGGRMKRLALAALLMLAACRSQPAAPSDVLVVALANAPTNLDPGVGLDEASQKLHQLLYSHCSKIDANLKVVPTWLFDSKRPIGPRISRRFRAACVFTTAAR
jgi:DNA mismatch repair protein MutS